MVDLITVADCIACFRVLFYVLEVILGAQDLIEIQCGIRETQNVLTWLTATLVAGFAKSLARDAGNKTVFGEKFKMRDFREKRAGVRDQDPPLAPPPPHRLPDGKRESSCRRIKHVGSVLDFDGLAARKNVLRPSHPFLPLDPSVHGSRFDQHQEPLCNRATYFILFENHEYGRELFFSVFIFFFGKRRKCSNERQTHGTLLSPSPTPAGQNIKNSQHSSRP